MYKREFKSNHSLNMKQNDRTTIWRIFQWIFTMTTFAIILAYFLSHSRKKEIPNVRIKTFFHFRISKDGANEITNKKRWNELCIVIQIL